MVTADGVNTAAEIGRISHTANGMINDISKNNGA
jgi:hypothetical protein